MNETNVQVLNVEKQLSPIERMRIMLDAKIPHSVISKRDGGNGRKLDYLEGWYVIDRLNTIFGQGNWAYTTDEMRLVHSGEVNGKFVAHYVAKVTVIALGTAFSDFGYGDGVDARNPGKAHELAVKEAVTDGVKRCAKNFGRSMGLALYDKSRENVDDGESENESKIRTGNTSGSKVIESVSSETVAINTTSATPSGIQSESTGVSGSTTPQTTREALNRLIASAAMVYVRKRLGDAAALKQYLKTTYAVESKEALTDDQASAFLMYLEKSINA